MSMNCEIAQGIGLVLDDSVISRIDDEKLTKALKNQLSFDYEDVFYELYPEGDKDKDFFHKEDIGLLLYGVTYNYIAEIFEETMQQRHVLTYAHIEGDDVLFIPPVFPWQVKEDDPKTEEEAIDLICQAVMNLTNMTKEEVKEKIDTDLYLADFS